MEKEVPKRLLDDQINIELTKKLKSQEKYKRLKKWLEDNGAIYPKV